MDDPRSHGTKGAGEQADSIWLRYATQFTMAGRNYTVEMGIPMPVGASEQTREELLREADAGMNQLSRHVENRVAQMLQRPQSPQSTQPAQGAIPTPPANAKPAIATSSTPQQPIVKPAAAPAPQSNAQPLVQADQPSQPSQSAQQPAASASSNVRETREASSDQPTQSNEVAAPRVHTNVGASMPFSPNSINDVNGNISLPQFIQHIKENLGLTPAQAMEQLKVKSLSGINLRQALEKLQRISTQGAQGTTDTNAKARENTATSATQPGERPSQSGARNAATSSSTTTATSTVTPPSAQSTHPSVQPSGSPQRQASQEAYPNSRGNVRDIREGRPAQAFDEEVDLEDEEEPVLEELDDLDDLDLPRELTPHERMQAKNVVSRLQESRGATVANGGRLQALQNVAGSQISPEQMQDLIQGIWGVSSLKKLKVDQVEALISWAKEDDFTNDVELVLALLEEEA